MAGINTERNRLLKRLEGILEGPLTFLGFFWLILLIIELVHGSNPFPDNFSLAIWVILSRTSF